MTWWLPSDAGSLLDQLATRDRTVNDVIHDFFVNDRPYKDFYRVNVRLAKVLLSDLGWNSESQSRQHLIFREQATRRETMMMRRSSQW